VSVDPLQHEYPHYTPYQYAGNMPITYIDLDGLEPGVLFENKFTNRIIEESYNPKSDGSGSFWVDTKGRQSGWSHDAPQRYFGYFDIYDDYMGTLFDLHATKFEMETATLRLWKGDYGMHRDLLPSGMQDKVGGAGGEIGLYNPSGSSMTIDDLMKIGIVSTNLEVINKRTGELVANRKEETASFWTTTFSWDKSEKPKEMYTINTFTFKDEVSATNFHNGLDEVKKNAAGYFHNQNESIKIDINKDKVIITWGK
jgi:hypothetical protein